VTIACLNQSDSQVLLGGAKRLSRCRLPL